MTIRVEQILDRLREQQPNALALSDTLGHEWRYVDLADAVDDLAEQLRAMGVRRNDRVLLILENCAPAVAALFAIARVGASVIPFNARQIEVEIARVISHAEPAAILFTSAASNDAAAHAKRLGATLMTGVGKTMHALALTSSPDNALSDVATILYTTGTTGTPKGVMLTHDNLIFAGNISATVRGMTTNDVVYGALPISHVFGLASVVMASMLSGAAIRLEPRFSAENLYKSLISGITLLSAVPQMHALLMQYTKEQGHTRLPSNNLRYVSSGAAPLDLDWKRRAEAFFRLPLQNGYGMTESTAGICLTSHDQSNVDISVGKPLPGVQIKLDKEAPGGADDVGEILVHGGGVMKGYFRNQEETLKNLSSDGWLRTGDLGRLDDGGNLHIMGRSKELIIHGGFNVYPPEVEAAFNDHPQVIQCAVIGQMVQGDEQVYAFVEASRTDWPGETELRAFVAARLIGYKRPSRIVLTEKLPAAPTGKILKNKLVELL